MYFAHLKFTLDLTIENNLRSKLASLLIDRKFLGFLNVAIADFQVIANTTVLTGISIDRFHSQYQIIRNTRVLKIDIVC